MTQTVAGKGVFLDGQTVWLTGGVAEKGRRWSSGSIALTAQTEVDLVASTHWHLDTHLRTDRLVQQTVNGIVTIEGIGSRFSSGDLPSD